MNHRRTVGRRAFVPPVWLIWLTVAAAIVGTAGLGALAYDRYAADGANSSTAADSAPAEPVPTASPTPSTEPVEPAPVEPAPTPTASPSPTADASDAIRAATGVSVLNNTGRQGLAGSYAADVEDLGWADVKVGNWRGNVGGNTVYYPADLEDQARLLASDLGIDRLRPIVDGMRSDRLTVILVDPASSVP